MNCSRCKRVVPAVSTVEGLWCTTCGYVRKGDQDALQVERGMLRGLIMVFVVSVVAIALAASVHL